MDTQPITVTITFNPETNKFTVEHNGESEAFDAVDRALQEARGYLTGMDESEEPAKEEQAESVEDEGNEEKDFEEGFQKARGIPL